MIRFAALVLLLASRLPAQAPMTPPQPAPAAPAPAGEVRVTITTGAGPITVALDMAKAPLTSANFLRYVDGKRLDGTSFYRAVKVADEPLAGLIQGGTRNDPKKTLKPIAHEPTSRTGLSHVDGAIAMARAAPGTASGDFFIVVGGFPSMDADPSQPGDNLGYAVFGRVVEGMDVVRTVLKAPTAAGGPAEMKGQILAQPVRIATARRAPSAVSVAPAQAGGIAD